MPFKPPAPCWAIRNHQHVETGCSNVGHKIMLTSSKRQSVINTNVHMHTEAQDTKWTCCYTQTHAQNAPSMHKFSICSVSIFCSASSCCWQCSIGIDLIFDLGLDEASKCLPPVFFSRRQTDVCSVMMVSSMNRLASSCSPLAMDSYWYCGTC